MIARRAVLFARVSTDDRGQTTESQFIALRDVGRRLGWEIVAEVPLEVSAWNDRTSAQVRRTALDAVRDHRADVLAVWALDRVSRAGIAPAFALIDELERHLGAAFYSYQEPFLSTATADASMRPLMLALFAWMGEQESRRKSERLTARVATTRERGEAIGQRGKWGRGHLTTADDADRVLALAGKSVREIAAETGIARSTVARMLRPKQTIGAVK